MQDWFLFLAAGLLVFLTVVGIMEFQYILRKKIMTLTKENGKLRKELIYLQLPANEIKNQVELKWKDRLTVREESHTAELTRLSEQHQQDRDELSQHYLLQIANQKEIVTTHETTLQELEQQINNLETTISQLTEERKQESKELERIKGKRDERFQKAELRHLEYVKELNESQQESQKDLLHRFTTAFNEKVDEIASLNQQIKDLSSAKASCETQLESLTHKMNYEQEELQKELETLTKEKQEEERFGEELAEKLELCREYAMTYAEALSAVDPGTLHIETLKDRSYKMIMTKELSRDSRENLDMLLGPDVEFVRIPPEVDLFNPTGQPVRDPSTWKLMEYYEPGVFCIWTLFASALRDLEKKRDNLLGETPALTNQELLTMKETRTYKELAAETGISKGTLKRRIKKAQTDQNSAR